MWFLNSSHILGLFGGSRNVHYYTAFFGLFMFMGIFNAFCARTHSVNLADHIAGNKPFILIMSLVTAVQVLILYFGGQIFRTNGLSWLELLIVVGLSLVVVVANIIRKAGYKLFKIKVSL